MRGFERVIVECHPALIGDRCLRFRDLLAGRLEVAIGLETVHPDVLARLNKRFTVADFQRAAAFLAAHDIALRVFLLLRPPFLTEAEGVVWAKRSLDAAFDAGAAVCCVIPTRGGNGAMEALAASGDYAPPTLPSLEAVQEYGLGLRAGPRLRRPVGHREVLHLRLLARPRARLAEMNRTQRCRRRSCARSVDSSCPERRSFRSEPPLRGRKSDDALCPRRWYAPDGVQPRGNAI